ncbi:MAG: antibiotic biosynthesis monooxygenase [Hyphomonadaceae bacterium]|jgi:quinol monooxygenase YgiN|nr:antibiotic biosynthesis monooxygenase [Hyphomonadaceae bacterium]
MGDQTPDQRKKRPPPQGAVCAIVRVETLSGKSGEFASILSDLAHRVRNEEDGCTAYHVTRALGSSDHFAVHARFEDWAAFKGHADTAHLKRALPRINALLAAPIAMELYLDVD